MVDVVSIVIAVVSLVGAILSAGITAFVTFYNEKTKRESDARKLVAKYRDPLLLASKELQSRLFNIAENDMIPYYYESRRGFVVDYTAFLIGQYLAWAYILRRQIQFLRFSTNENDNRKLIHLLDSIQETFSTDRFEENPDEALFSLWRGQQMAIGELMTIRQDDQLVCMGYAEFTEKFHAEDVKFGNWFAPVTESIAALAAAWSQDNVSRAAPRLRRLQHLLMDLMEILSSQELGSNQQGVKLRRANPAPYCYCTKCKSSKNYHQEG